MTSQMSGFSFVTLKAFGDYVIAYSNLRYSIKASTHIVGAHLGELAKAVDPEWCPIVLSQQELSVPAAFDVRKKGLIAAAHSLSGLRKAISQLPDNNILVFDRWTMRERLLAGRRPATCLPSAPNIYMAYKAFLESNGLASIETSLLPSISQRPRGNKVRIFASSRLEKKKMPLALCKQLLAELGQRGEDVELVALAHEYPELEASNLPKRILPKDFQGMIDCVAESKRVISSDSLPAHIAELYGLKPVVVSPIENSYWLPQTSFDTGAWSLFDHGSSGVMAAIERADG
jgi:hypothetical protein